MQAIIMAAGKGSRLENLTKDKPKSFLEIKGYKLIEYNIALLHAFGIKDILIVTGYMNEMVEELTEKIEGIRCIYNPFFEMVNVLGSFYMAQEYLEDDTIYMHADTLCSPEIFEDMLGAEGDMVLPVEFKLCDEEAMKIRLENDKLVEISKQIPCEEGEGEFIGIAKLGKSVLADLRQETKRLMKQGAFNSYFEGAIQGLIDKDCCRFTIIPTQNRFWGEIDFLEDYKRVEAEMPENLYTICKLEQDK